MRILIVEDEPVLQRQLRADLEALGYAVDVCGDGREALYRATEYSFDAAVVDLGLPGLPGLEVVRRLRREGSRLPVMVLTARSRWQDKVEGLEAGADDYLTKPFAPKELSARIRALLRRIRPADHVHSTLTFGDLVIIPEEGRVTVRGDEVLVTKTEFRLLCVLAENPSGVFSREQLLEKVWDYDYFGDGRLVDVHVRRLRMKIELDPANPRHVVTVRGLGYRLQS
jgi:DNA-binding response OmpR family regulator